jgi:hypothetical protein
MPGPTRLVDCLAQIQTVLLIPPGPTVSCAGARRRRRPGKKWPCPGWRGSEAPCERWRLSHGQIEVEVANPEQGRLRIRRRRMSGRCRRSPRFPSSDLASRKHPWGAGPVSPDTDTFLSPGNPLPQAHTAAAPPQTNQRAVRILITRTCAVPQKVYSSLFRSKSFIHDVPKGPIITCPVQ